MEKCHFYGEVTLCRLIVLCYIQHSQHIKLIGRDAGSVQAVFCRLLEQMMKKIIIIARERVAIYFADNTALLN